MARSKTTHSYIQKA